MATAFGGKEQFIRTRWGHFFLFFFFVVVVVVVFPPCVSAYVHIF